MLTCPHCGCTFVDSDTGPIEYRGVSINGVGLQHAGGRHHITPHERAVCRLLVRARGNVVRTEAIENYLYAHYPDNEWPDRQTIRAVRWKALDLRSLTSMVRDII